MRKVRQEKYSVLVNILLSQKVFCKDKNREEDEETLKEGSQRDLTNHSHFQASQGDSTAFLLGLEENTRVQTPPSSSRPLSSPSG